MGSYLCNNVSTILQATKRVTVVDKGAESWTFKYKEAKLNARVLPGCCGILLLYKISGKANEALALIRLSATAAKKANFGMVTLSLIDSSPLGLLLREPDWCHSGFRNPRTGNHVSLYTHEIISKPKPVKPVTRHEDN